MIVVIIVTFANRPPGGGYAYGKARCSDSLPNEHDICRRNHHQGVPENRPHHDDDWHAVRGMRSTYQHCSEKHLHRYLAEFDFRYNKRAAFSTNDLMRAEILAAGIQGKRLTYRRPRQA